ncbi:MAG: hypothetical protein ACXWM7_05180, partial [Parachlamydiaceae bacterium]
MIPDLRFSIDSTESNLTGTLAVTVSRPLTFDLIRQQVLHKELLQLLYQQEVNFNTKARNRPIGGNTPLSMFHVSYLVSTRVIELLAKSRVFYFNHKLLVCDLHSQTTFYYLIESQGTDRPKISGKLVDNGDEFDLSECDFLCTGNYHYYIRGISLKQITTEIAWKDLKQLYLTPNEVQLSQIQKNYGEEEYPDQPKLVYQEGVEAIVQNATQPLPFLKLTDRLGAFANLWLCYPILNRDQQVKISFHDSSPWLKDEKRKPLFKRDFVTEKQWEKDLLETDFVRKVTGATHYYCPVDCVAKSL